MLNIKTWKEGEKIVADYMKERGYKIIYTNFSCKIAELDIVAILPKKVQKSLIKAENLCQIAGLKEKTKIKMLKMNLKNRLKQTNDLLVITEVKARSNNKFGTGLDAITSQKRQHLRRGAEVLLKMKRFAGKEVRFDVASVDSGEITYIENAF